jgi:hypothetical protein
MQTFVNKCPDCSSAHALFPVITAAIFASETPMVCASEIFVNMKGGQLAKIAMNHIKQAFAQDIARAERVGLSAICDTTIHTLQDGMYPTQPGWHCDAVPRSSYHGQPMFNAILSEAFSVTVVIGSDLGMSHDEFVMDPLKVRTTDKDVYRQVAGLVDRVAPVVSRFTDGVFIKTTPKTIYRSTPSQRPGKRFCFRYTMFHKPPLVNEIPQVQQVYLVAPPSH